MFQIILNILLVSVLLYGLYFFITGLFAFIKPKRKKTNDTNYENKFAIIIAARNEEKVIGNLIDSLKAQNYNKDRYEIDVMVNNCTDNTKYVALDHGANVIDVDVKVKSKGEVLRYAFSKMKSKDFDAYVVFDADNIVHPDFLMHMNDSLNQGYNVAQGYRDSKNYSDNWISGSYTLFYYMENFFLNLSRKNVGLSAHINGTGFVVRKSFIEEIDFNPKTITEDVELTGICAINDCTIDFVKDAITYDEQPTSFKESWKQRLRWSKGNLQCFIAYRKQLIKSLFSTKNLSCLDMCLTYFGPILQTISFFVLFLVTALDLMTVGSDNILSWISEKKILMTIVGYLASVAVLIFLSKYNKKSVKDLSSGIILYILFIYSWIPINIVCFFKREIKWSHIEHNKSIKIDNLLKVNK